MPFRSTTSKFGALAQSFHWVIVIGVMVQYAIVTWAEDSAAAREADLMILHRSIGLTILLLAVLRLGWRAIDRRPQWPATMSRLERGLASGAHALLYALIFAIPLSGWALSSAEGDRIEYFGWFEVPPIAAAQSSPTNSPPVHDANSGLVVDDDDATEESQFAEQLEELHELLFNALAALALLHLMAAMKHQFWDRDQVLRSMLPGGRRRIDDARPVMEG